MKYAFFALTSPFVVVWFVLRTYVILSAAVIAVGLVVVLAYTLWHFAVIGVDYVADTLELLRTFLEQSMGD